MSGFDRIILFTDYVNRMQETNQLDIIDVGNDFFMLMFTLDDIRLKQFVMASRTELEELRDLINDKLKE